MKWRATSSERVEWQRIKLVVSDYLSPPPVKLTTELKTSVPKLDLLSVARSVPAWENTWVMAPLIQPSQVVGAVAEPPLVRQEIKLEMNTVEPDLASFVIPAEVWKAPTEAEVSKAEIRIPQEWANMAVPNVVETLPLSLFNLTEAPSPPTPRVILGELLRRTGKEAQRLLRALQEKLDQLLMPAPTLALGPVHTRGPARKRGGPDEQAEGQVTAFVLDEAWELERTLSLTVRDGPVIRNGRLTLLLQAEDPSLQGRRADLALVVEGMEVVLCSAEVSAGKEGEAEITFSLDLAEAGIRVRDGMLPLGALRVFLEPRLQRGRNEK